MEAFFCDYDGLPAEVELRLVDVEQDFEGLIHPVVVDGDQADEDSADRADKAFLVHVVGEGEVQELQHGRLEQLFAFFDLFLRIVFNVL